MTIQKMRYEERIRLEVNMDEETLGCKVIPLIIQPIVENALNHAIDKGVGTGLIRIQSAMENGNLKVVVEDDGIGLSAAQLDALRNRLKHSKDLGGTSGNGLLNVHRRILLHYGEPFGLSLESMPYQGLKVVFTLPVNRADHEQETDNRLA
jgi:two-component system sensor histidine kinase YesM